MLKITILRRFPGGTETGIGSAERHHTAYWTGQPEFSAHVVPDTFCASLEKQNKHLYERRDPHHAQTAPHGAYQHADQNEYMPIDPEIMHWRHRISAQWPQQCKQQ